MGSPSVSLPECLPIGAGVGVLAAGARAGHGVDFHLRQQTHGRNDTR